MAWTTPKTWADGDIPDADDLNTHIKANLDVLSTHAHSGAAGDGSAALAPITTVTFVNQGSTPAAPGSTKVNIFSESETLKVREGASGAAVAISLATHTHTQASGASNTNTKNGATGLGTSYSGSSKGCSITVTPSDSTGSARYLQVITAAALFQNANGYSGTVYQNIEKDGSQLVEFSASMAAPINTEVQIIGTHVEIAAAASSSVYQTDFKKAGSMNGNVHDTYEAIREVRCL